MRLAVGGPTMVGQSDETKEAAMRVRDLMTTDVLTIGPEAPIRDVARILAERRISGLPVCSIEGHVLGVVSEGDVLYKEHDPDESRLGGPLGWLLDAGPTESVRRKARARKAGEAMSSPAVTIPPYESVSTAARLMAERGVNRLPVVDGEDRVIGIVTRADLVRAFARPDAEVEREIREDVLRATMWVDEGRVDVNVSRGAVTLRGGVDRRSDAELLSRLAARVPGVVAVESSVTWRIDDLARTPSTA
jgi:CBS domain-containing protein